MEKFALIFDMDGLLIDSEKLYRKASFELLNQFGKIPGEDLFKKCIGRKLAQSMAIYVEMMDLPVSPDKMLYLMQKTMTKLIGEELTMMPGALDILEFYNGKCPIALATGSTKTILKAVLEKTNIEKYFDVILSSDEVKNGKPEPDIFLKAMEKLQVENDKCIIFEDAQNGVIAGRRAGAYVIAIPNEHTIKYDFSAADIVVKNLYKAMDHLHDRLA